MLEKQELSFNFSEPALGLEWVETYDMLQRNWPYSKKGRQPPLIEAAARMVKRRHHRPMPPRLAFKSTVDYYEALMPLMVMHQHFNQMSSPWRYVCPMMLRLILARWPSIHASRHLRRDGRSP